MKSLTCILLLLILVSGCSSPSAPVVPIPPHQTPFVFHKPRLGATFTMQAMGSIDTTYIFTVTDTALTLGGKTGVLKFEGYYKPFFINYRDNGDIDIAGNFDYIAGRDSWTWYPLSLDAGLKTEAYSHDSLISNPDPNDTRQIIRDTLFVTGRETLTIKGLPVECIKAVRTYYYELTGLKYGFKIKDALHVDYWYAPSLGYWAKVNINDKGFIDTFTLIDFTL